MNFLMTCIFIFMSFTANIYTLSAGEKGNVDDYWKMRLKPSFIVVSCSGKSGSTTLQQSFQNLGFDTFRVHNLLDKHFEMIADKSPDTNIIFVDSIRDILSRKISSFFQNLTKHTGMTRKEIKHKYKEEGLDFLFEAFDQRILTIAQNYAFQKWKNLGYDCLNDAQFDFDKKYQFKHINNLYFVNLRFDEIENWETIIKSINLPINLKKFKVIATNLSQNKWYHEIYSDFKKNFSISRANFNQIMNLNDAELNHFYTESEIQAFIDKWTPYIYD